MSMRLIRLLIALPALLPAALLGEMFVVGPEDDWFAKLSGDGLKPGDQLVFKAGTYSDRRLLELRHRGTAEKPIVIRKSEGRVIFKRPDARQNSFNLVGCQHLTLFGFEITGGDAGIRIRSDGKHQPVNIRLEGLHIHHIGGAAVTCNNAGSYYERMHFLNNHIHHTGGHGEGFYLGCNNDKDGKTPGYIYESVIEDNHIHDLKGGTVSQGDGIEIKDGSYGNVIRNNRIHDTKYPGITVYGTDGKKPNLIEGNHISNTGDNGIQVAADAIVRSNIVVDAGGDAIHVREHQSAQPGNLQIVGNTLVQQTPGKTGLRIQRPSGGFSGAIGVKDNAIYAARAMRVPKDAKISLANNVGSGKSDRPLALGEWDPSGDRARDLDENDLPSADSFLNEKAAGARRP